jgi:hypothetical protein
MPFDPIPEMVVSARRSPIPLPIPHSAGDLSRSISSPSDHEGFNLMSMNVAFPVRSTGERLKFRHCHRTLPCVKSLPECSECDDSDFVRTTIIIQHAVDRLMKSHEGNSPFDNLEHYTSRGQPALLAQATPTRAISLTNSFVHTLIYSRIDTLMN